MWVDFEPLGDPRSDYVQRAALPCSIGDVLSHLFDELASRPGIEYNEIKRSFISANAQSKAGAGRSEESIILLTRAGKSAQRGTKMVMDKCAYYLKGNHLRRECRRYLAGKTPARESNGMPHARNVRPRPRNNERRDETDGQ